MNTCPKNPSFMVTCTTCHHAFMVCPSDRLLNLTWVAAPQPQTGVCNMALLPRCPACGTVSA